MALKGQTGTAMTIVGRRRRRKPVEDLLPPASPCVTTVHDKACDLLDWEHGRRVCTCSASGQTFTT